MKWNFPSANNALHMGAGQSGVETFRGSPISSLAREICQNSIDATLEGQVTKIDFMPFQINSNNFPDRNGLEDAILKSKDFWKEQKSSRNRDFLNLAFETISASKINFLRISDFNTTGLLGAEKNEHNTPWSNLTKGSGVSDKYGSSGGSFGIGKYATFACSTLGTIFYSTIDTNGVGAFQGVSHLTSFKDSQGNTTLGLGYLGGENNTPLLKKISMDFCYERQSDQTGTDIFVAGFQYASTDWKIKMVESILDGFLYAIFMGSLVVRIDDININKDTLPSLIEELVSTKSDSIKSIINYYEVLTSSSKWLEDDFMNMGKIRLKLDIKEGYHKKVAMIRKTGMKIMDRSRINNIIPFAGVMIIEGNTINEFLRNIENPQHTKWEPQRAVHNESYAKIVLSNLVKFITRYLEELSEIDGTEFIDPDVGEFLPDSSGSDLFDHIDKRESLEQTVASVKRRKKTSFKKPIDLRPMDLEPTEEESLGDEGEEVGPSGSFSYSGKETKNNAPDGEREITDGGGQLTEQSSSIISIPASKLRVVCLDKNTGRYSIFFTPKISANDGELLVYMAAENANYEANIKNVSCMEQKGVSFIKNKITGLNFVKDNAIRFIIKIDYNEFCSLEVKANATKA